jgi:hypothetical protein
VRARIDERIFRNLRERNELSAECLGEFLALDSLAAAFVE